MTANTMIDATDPALYEAPESFNGVRMNVSGHINFLAVVDSLVRVAASANAVVGAEVIGEYHRSWEHVFFDESSQRVGFYVSGDESSNLSLALNHANDGSLIGSASAPPFAPASVVRLVHLHFAAKSANRPTLLIGQHGANLLEHAPRRFVGDASLALDLFRRNSATGSRHEVHCIEPRCKRSGRLVKDRASGRMDMVSAMVAAVGRAAHNAVVLRNALAVLAKDAFGIEMILEPFEAGGVIGELLLEGF